jgi:CTP:molybdopterin cytidylyltransferase MocA
MNTSMNTNIGAVIVAAGLSSRMGEYKPLMEIGGETIARRVVGAFIRVGVDPIVVVTGHKAEELEAHLRKYINACTEAHPQEPLGARTEADGRGDGTASNRPVLHFIRNEAYQTTSMFESAKIGLSYILDKCARTFFCPIDVPLFTVGTVRKLMLRESPVVKPIYKGKEGHPILIDATLIPEIIGLERIYETETGFGNRTKTPIGRGTETKSGSGMEEAPKQSDVTEANNGGGMKGALAKFESVTERIEVPDEGILYDADTPDDIIRLIKLL